MDGCDFNLDWIGYKGNTATTNDYKVCLVKTSKELEFITKTIWICLCKTDQNEPCSQSFAVPKKMFDHLRFHTG